eukprot:9476275-Pyramimonas_sp.AAC.2
MTYRAAGANQGPDAAHGHPHGGCSKQQTPPSWALPRPPTPAGTQSLNLTLRSSSCKFLEGHSS